jgi:hypothetical protein
VVDNRFRRLTLEILNSELFDYYFGCEIKTVSFDSVTFLVSFIRILEGIKRLTLVLQLVD